MVRETPLRTPHNHPTAGNAEHQTTPKQITVHPSAPSRQVMSLPRGIVSGCEYIVPPDEFCRRELGWNGNSQVTVILHPTDGMDKSAHLLCLCRDGTI